MSKYGVFSGPYFPEFSPNTRKYGPEKAPYLDTFHAVDYFISKNLTLLKKNTRKYQKTSSPFNIINSLHFSI